MFTKFYKNWKTWWERNHSKSISTVFTQSCHGNLTGPMVYWKKRNNAVQTTFHKVLQTCLMELHLQSCMSRVSNLSCFLRNWTSFPQRNLFKNKKFKKNHLYITRTALLIVNFKKLLQLDFTLSRLKITFLNNWLSFCLIHSTETPQIGSPPL